MPSQRPKNQDGMSVLANHTNDRPSCPSTPARPSEAVVDSLPLTDARARTRAP